MCIRFAAATLALFLGACSSSTLSDDGRVRARPAGDAVLSITNGGGEPVYVLAADPTELMTMVACSPQTCPRVDPGGTLRLPYAAITGWQAADRQASVHWWTFDDGGAPRLHGAVDVEL